MNWEAVGAIAEIAGAVAVVLTLAYLAVQISQNTRHLQVTARQNQNEELGSFLDRLTDSAELRDTWAKLFAPHFYSAELQAKYGSVSNPGTVIAYRAFLNGSHMYYSWKAGTLSDDEWTQTSSLLDVYLSMDLVSDWWPIGGRPFFGKEFGEYAEKRMQILERR